MKSYTYIRWLTYIGLLAIITLQCVWLYTTCNLIQQDIQKECNRILNKALYTEVNRISKYIPEGKEIAGGPLNDSLPSITFLYDGLHQLGIEYSIHKIDSIVKNELRKENILSDYTILSINPKTGYIYESSNDCKLVQVGIIQSNIIPTRLDSSYGIQIALNSPYLHIIKRMGLLLLSTVMLSVFVIFCIAFQIKIIISINKISQIREDFSYAMVHDMKTPLSSILSALNFLQGGRLDNKPEMKEKFFNIAKDEADHLLTLTNKILTISKLENNKLEMNCEMVTLKPLLLKISEKFMAKSPKPVTFKLDLETESIYADAEYIEEVFCNMIDNSIKYSKDSVDINISSSENSKYSIIKIYDNGLGMNDDDQLKIFNKYERVYAGSKKKTYASGFGLGLNFVQQVVEAHKGKIIVNSVEGEFTEFVIYLPLILKEL